MKQKEISEKYVQLAKLPQMLSDNAVVYRGHPSYGELTRSPPNKRAFSLEEYPTYESYYAANQKTRNAAPNSRLSLQPPNVKFNFNLFNRLRIR